ncbi:hypothetical protein [Rhodococcus chondri]|uniref:Uncharacterized protein n=1 Tax=Rhodococcus chondri TaxID=3065941 RepID=A0ABU7JY50_9NOCA|nr:hypothetical protein [Rhodococcus sp. CC-R104]MEE2034212.1 hypothetical protein [Rhodococcus sp. CC-R104]
MTVGIASVGCVRSTEGDAISVPSVATATRTSDTRTSVPVPADLDAEDCSARDIASDLGDPAESVDVMRCYGDWALISIGTLGDTTSLVRHADSGWVRFAGFPSAMCRGFAAAQGAPDELLVNFPDCAENPPGGDLGLSVPMSVPSCDGMGIVVVGNAVDPASYASEVQHLLDANPGSSYLRTDRSCPSLRQADERGNAIYAVYFYAGYTHGEVCAAVRDRGGDAYGKVLDRESDPAAVVECR